jgi:FlaA1/EpsC-like NDP-sugar epimerase
LQSLASESMVSFEDAQPVSSLVRNRTRFCMVRFGNVLGSSGSVVPLFRKQIEAGGPITLTHSDVTRYFMTIPEAAQLVLQAGAMGEGGEVFLLDMGQPVRIFELARRLIELSGRTICDEASPDGEIAIKITGLRPGEKLYEELLIGDNPSPTAHPRIMKAKEAYVDWDELRPRLADLARNVQAHNADGARAVLAHLVSGYQPFEPEAARRA